MSPPHSKYQQVALNDEDDDNYQASPAAPATLPPSTATTTSTSAVPTQQPPVLPQQPAQSASSAVVGFQPANSVLSDFVNTTSGFFSRVAQNIQSDSIPATAPQQLPSSSSAVPTNAATSSTQPQMIDQLQNAAESNPEVNSLVTKLRSRNWRQSLRPPQLFVNPRAFSRPRTSLEVTKRLEENLGFYFTNYLILVLMVTLFSVLSTPSVLILLVVLVAMWTLALRRETISIGSTELSGRTKITVLGSITAVLTFLIAGSLIFSIVGISSVFVCGHAVFNNRNGMTIEEIQNESGEGENDPFLNV